MRLFMLFAIAGSLSACATGPDLNNDPRSGGLFGGVSGLMRGDYDARTQQRQISVDRLNQAKSLLSQESSLIDQQKTSKAAQLNTIGSEVASLDAEVAGLTTKISTAKRSASISKAKIQDITARKKSLQNELATIQGSIDNQQLTVEEAEVKRDKLRQEYKQLVDLLNNL